MATAQVAQAKYANRHRRAHVFSVGDLVMLDAGMARLTADHGAKEKLRPRRLGPFKVLAVPTPVTVRLNLPLGTRIHDVVHVSHVLPFRTSVQNPHTVPQDRPRATGRKKGVRTYIIERIVSKTADGLNYIIKWQGWPKPTPHLVAEIKADQPELAAAFERTLQSALAPARRSARARHPTRASR